MLALLPNDGTHRQRRDKEMHCLRLRLLLTKKVKYICTYLHKKMSAYVYYQSLNDRLKETVHTWP